MSLTSRLYRSSHVDVSELPSALEILTNKEDPDQDLGRGFMSVVCDALQASVVARLSHLEAHDPVQVEVPKELLARLDRFETTFKTANITNQHTIDAINTLRADFNKLLEQRSSLPIRHPLINTDEPCTEYQRLGTTRCY